MNTGEADIVPEVLLPASQASELREGFFRLRADGAEPFDWVARIAHGRRTITSTRSPRGCESSCHTFSAAAGELRDSRQHLESVVKRLSIRPGGAAVRPVFRGKGVCLVDVGPGYVEASARRKLADY